MSLQQTDLETKLETSENEGIRGRRRFLGTLLRGGVGLAGSMVLASFPKTAISAEPTMQTSAQANPELKDLVLKDYSSLTEALGEYASLRESTARVEGNLVSILKASEAKKLPSTSLIIEPITLRDGSKRFITVYDFGGENAASYASVLKSVSSLQPKTIPHARKSRKDALQAGVLDGTYIQLSANRDESLVMEAVLVLRKAGCNNFTLQYDSEAGEAGMIKTLIGPFPSESPQQAAEYADKLLLNDDVLDMLESNELGIVKVTARDGPLSYEWVDVVKEAKPMQDMKERQRVKKRIAKRNKRVKRSGRKTYSFDELESIIRGAVENHNAQSPGNRVDYDLARAFAYCESTYNPRAIGYKVSGGKKVPKGRGLFQLLPQTAMDMGKRSYTQEELFDPRINSDLGVRFIAYLQQRPRIKKGTTPESRATRLLAAYNGGEKALQQSTDCDGQMIYQCEVNRGYRETRNYVKKVLAQYRVFKAESGRSA
ncbi:transglycosylase SLT domain-containing protein [Candidatus Woesearchaeota archaeon]|nr:transglycosylase SLT domain-containing protein [Candidatus Woesearchaeota archaeon]